MQIYRQMTTHSQMKFIPNSANIPQNNILQKKNSNFNLFVLHILCNCNILILIAWRFLLLFYVAFVSVSRAVPLTRWSGSRYNIYSLWQSNWYDGAFAYCHRVHFVPRKKYICILRPLGLDYMPDGRLPVLDGCIFTAVFLTRIL